MMLGWMIVFLGVGFVIGTLVMLSSDESPNDFGKNH